jgi:ADP-ribose pyrophosphatase YjhB (NUDIX family)
MTSSGRVLVKVTAFITQGKGSEERLLLFRHPHAGIQVPAGTAEPGEEVRAAVVREAQEESGIMSLSNPRELAVLDEPPPPGHSCVVENTGLYARPDISSFNWAQLRRGLTVRVDRDAGDFVQVSYIEHDRYPEQEAVSYQLTGWVPRQALTSVRRRHLFELRCVEETAERWMVDHDGPRWELFWTPLDSLPDVVDVQAHWLSVFLRERATIPQKAP